MRSVILIGIAGGVAVAAVGYFLWLVLRSLFDVFSDWRLGKEVDVIEKEASQRRTQQMESNRERLNNGCEHEFELGPGAMPRRACRRCGKEATTPEDGCDHVWQRIPGSVPRSYCNSCGKEINGWVGIAKVES